MQNIPDLLKTARKVSTPLVAISTADPWATMTTINESFKRDNETDGKAIPPIVQWDCCRAFLPVNDAGGPAIRQIMPTETYPGQTPGLNLVEALMMVTKFPKKTLLFMLNAHRYFNEPGVIQGIMNLREVFKEDQRTLVLLGPVIQLPPELQQDVMTFDEALPTPEAIRAIVVEQVGLAREVSKAIAQPSDEEIRRATEALTGLATFPVEQSTAMSLASAAGLDMDQLWSRKVAFVQQTKGLKFDSTRETFDDIGGLDFAKEHGRDMFNGALPPTAVIRIDEIEKHMAGASGVVADSSGVSQDALGVILREMEDNEWRGLIAVGPPGSGKSIYSKTLGRTHQVPTIELDLGALKGSFVGQSEENIRLAMKVLKAIAGKGAYFVATCNKLDVLPPELRRRFIHGIWFFDVPTAEELIPIWAINLRRYGVKGTDGQPLTLDNPDTKKDLLELSAGWTGAEVRNVCRLAFEMNKPIREMARRIVPVSVSDPDAIDRLRRLASGKFLSASHPGAYVHPADRTNATVGKRFMES